MTMEGDDARPRNARDVMKMSVYEKLQGSWVTFEVLNLMQTHVTRVCILHRGCNQFAEGDDEHGGA